MSAVPEEFTQILFSALLLAQSDGAQAEIKFNGAVLHVSYGRESLESDSVEVVPSWWQPGENIQNFLSFFIPVPAFRPEWLVSEDLSAMPYSWGSRVYPAGEKKAGSASLFGPSRGNPLSTECPHQVINFPRRHPVNVGFHDHRIEGFINPPATLQQGRKETSLP